MPQITVKTSSKRKAAMYCLIEDGIRFMARSPESGDVHDDEVDYLDAGEREDEPADAVDPQVPAEHLAGRGRLVADAAQRERYQRGDDQRVEDDRRGDRRVRAVQFQDVELFEAGEHPGEHGREHREVLRDVVGDGEGRQRTPGDQELLADLDDLDELRRVGV